jgi:tRNA (guanosine-2'-O-)-methyltransferase
MHPNKNVLIPGNIPADAWEVLSPTLSAARQQRMQEVAAQRTRHLHLVLQDIINPHNVSACLRSAEAFGLSQVSVVNTRAFFKASTAAKGVGSWLDISVQTSIAESAAALRRQGYRLAMGVPSKDAATLEDLSVTEPLAVIFGNEHSGVSPEWLNYIDATFTIPMAGFVESLNISVSAAIALQRLSVRARQELGPAQYCISVDEQRSLLNRWIWQQRPSIAQEYLTLSKR